MLWNDGHVQAAACYRLSTLLQAHFAFLSLLLTMSVQWCGNKAVVEEFTCGRGAEILTELHQDAGLRVGPYLLEEIGVCNLLAGAAPAHLEAQQVRGKGGR